MQEELVNENTITPSEDMNSELNLKSIFGCLGKIVLVIVFLAFIYIFSVFNCSKEMGPETHLIPNNFIGEVNIIFNSKDGIKRERTNGSRIYRIPVNGILKTKFSNNTGWLSNPEGLKFIYHDTISGNISDLIRIDWPERVPLEKVDSNSIVVHNFGYMKTNDEQGSQISMLTYLVDTLKNFPYYNHYIDSLRKE